MRKKLLLVMFTFLTYSVLAFANDSITVGYAFPEGYSNEYFVRLNAQCQDTDPDFLTSKIRPMKYLRPSLMSYLVIKHSLLKQDNAKNYDLAVSLQEGKTKVGYREGPSFRQAKEILASPNIGETSNVTLSTLGQLKSYAGIFGKIDTNSPFFTELKPYFVFYELASLLIFIEFPQSELSKGQKWSQSIKLSDNVSSDPIVVDLELIGVEKVADEELLKLSLQLKPNSIIKNGRGTMLLRKNGTCLNLDLNADVLFKPFFSKKEHNFNGGITVKNLGGLSPQQRDSHIMQAKFIIEK